MSEPQLRPLVVAVVAGMSTVTYATKAGGLWFLSRIDVSERTEAGLAALPGAVVVSILGPELVGAGPAEWCAAAVVLAVSWRTDNVLLALLGGVGAVLLFRHVL